MSKPSRAPEPWLSIPRPIPSICARRSKNRLHPARGSAAGEPSSRIHLSSSSSASEIESVKQEPTEKTELFFSPFPLLAPVLFDYDCTSLMKTEIISIGSELTSGQNLDTN